eukprot:1161668-Pelagomonas_calceolata.AAC.1
MPTQFAGLPDVERLVRKLDSRRAGNAIGLGELCQLYRVSARLPLIEDALRQHEGPHAQMLQERCVHASTCFPMLLHTPVSNQGPSAHSYNSLPMIQCFIFKGCHASCEV